MGLLLKPVGSTSSILEKRKFILIQVVKPMKTILCWGLVHRGNHYNLGRKTLHARSQLILVSSEHLKARLIFSWHKPIQLLLSCLWFATHNVEDIFDFRHSRTKATSGKPGDLTKNASQVHPLYTKCRIKLNLLQSWKVKSQLPVKWLLLQNLMLNKISSLVKIYFCK